MQLEVVLLLEGLLADRTLEAAADAVRGEVAPEVSLALENLVDSEGRGRGGALQSSVIMSSRPQKQNSWSLFQRSLWSPNAPSGSVGRGSSGRR